MKINPQLLRNVPGWENAPVPICFGGDYRALTFCCHPHYPLTFSSHCKRKEILDEIGMTEKEYIKIKMEFSKKYGWDDERVCFGSISYCCMRRGGCPGGRDHALIERYGNHQKELLTDDVLEKYFKLKKELAKIILQKAKNKDLVKDYIDLF
ncbi:MAG: methanogenesis marker 9 domain-containing protein [Candidatus Lokiarchaeota archaeon]|nr:methanogenesis marker 9 domain-containing protein [Candidatus Lokiarchaeota archaeon]